MNILNILRRVSLVSLVLLLTAFTTITALLADWWWFSEVGYEGVFIKTLTVKASLFFGVGFFVFGFLLLNFAIASRSRLPWAALLPESLTGRPLSVDGHFVRRVAFAIAALLGIFFGLVSAGHWQDVLKFVSGIAFGVEDPIFSKDVGFYIFTLPAIQAAFGLLKAMVLTALIGSAILYYLRGQFNIPGLFSIKYTHAEPGARMHIGVVLSLFFVLIALGEYISRFLLLTTKTGLVFGATYTDVHVGVSILQVSMVVALIAAVSALLWAWKGSISPLVLSVLLFFIVGFSSSLIPSVVHKLIVAPNELVKETPFIKHNIQATRQGFALDKIEEREISGDKPITAADIAANNLTVKNVRLWDRKPLLSTFSQIQEIRTYYEFTEVDNDRYIIDGEIRQVMLSPRELASDSLPNRNWINERLTFTHGYGVAAGPVNQVTPEGLPVLFVKDLPPKSDVKELEITQPEIYYGELSNDYVIVKTKSLEFNYPKGEENVYSTYDGKGGVRLNSLLKRVVFAIKFGSLKLLLSNDITNESRIMYHRNIIERVTKIAPFLTFDRDPYIVIADGRVYWIADAYTTSSQYPYSEPMRVSGRNVNYIRNSVKVVIDAHGGDVTMYQSDAKDPIINVYANIFPGTIKPLSEIPESLVSHLRYPEDIFTLQTAAYSTYHMDDPQIFYNKEDQWEVPSIATEGEGSPSGAVPSMQPRHIIMKLPGEKKEEYVLMLPFTPRSKDNLSAWMVASSDGDNYGKLLVYRFPKDKLVFGPKQIIGRINQHPEISQQISLWSQGGSQVIQGPLLVIPIEESLLYVRSLYLKANSGKIPELKRVIVAYENKIAMEETLEAGLARIFGVGTGGKQKILPQIPGRPTVQDTDSERFRNATKVYDEAIRAQRDGDWARYGEAIKRLGDILKN